MTRTTEAFSRVRIDALLVDAGWNPTDGTSVLFEHALPDGSRADYVLCAASTIARWRRPDSDGRKTTCTFGRRMQSAMSSS